MMTRFRSFVLWFMVLAAIGLGLIGWSGRAHAQAVESTLIPVKPPSLFNGTTVDWKTDNAIVEHVQAIHQAKLRVNESALQTLLNSLDSPHPLARRKAARALARQFQSNTIDTQPAQIYIEQLKSYTTDADTVVQKNIRRALELLETHHTVEADVSGGTQAIQ